MEEATTPELVCSDIDPEPPGYMGLRFFSATLEGNKQARAPTPDRTLLSNSTLD